MPSRFSLPSFKSVLSVLVGITVVGGILASSAFLQHRLWDGQQNRNYSEDNIAGVVPKGEHLRPATIGFEMLVADVFWIKTVQYLGGNIGRERPAQYALVNLVTDLDPKFERAYEMGTTFLEADGDFEHAKLLYSKYQKNLPDSWQAYYKAAYLYFYYLNDYDTAIWDYEQCMKKVGCLGGAERLLRVAQTRSGKYQIALENWTKVMQDPKTSDEDYKLAKMRVEEAMELWLLNSAAEEYHKNGKQIAQLSDLLGFSFSAPSGKRLKVDQNMITSPFENNPYQWSEKEKRVRTKLF
ncbi:MAG: hypothetical protein WCJ84_02825 [Candidatus Peregrinibacteria bacterium]